MLVKGDFQKIQTVTDNITLFVKDSIQVIIFYNADGTYSALLIIRNTPIVKFISSKQDYVLYDKNEMPVKSEKDALQVVIDYLNGVSSKLN